jgi:hypothetical protein
LNGPESVSFDGLDDKVDEVIPAAFNIPVSDPSSAGLSFLYNAASGLAPIDIAWKRSILSSLENIHLSKIAVPDLSLLSDETITMQGNLSVPTNCLFHRLLYEVPPPFICIEGPHGTGKTWMLSTLAARFVVGTRLSQPIFDKSATTREQKQRCTSRVENTTEKTVTNKTQNSGHAPQPFVVIMDSTYNLTTSQLAMLVRSSLIRQYKKHGRHSTKDVQQGEQFKRDMMDCLSRIHVTQVDDGRGWVAVLEALRHVLRERRQNEEDRDDRSKGRTIPTPILLLWDGLLSEFKSCQSNTIDETVFGSASRRKMTEEGSMRDILQEMSLLLRQESRTIWFVATSVTSTPQTNGSSNMTSASHRMLLDWMRNAGNVPPMHGNQRHANLSIDGTKAPAQHYRNTCRIFLERPSAQTRADGSSSVSGGEKTVPNPGISKSSAFARIEVAGDARNVSGNRFNPKSKKISYSLSLQGILS